MAKRKRVYRGKALKRKQPRSIPTNLPAVEYIYGGKVVKKISGKRNAQVRLWRWNQKKVRVYTNKKKKKYKMVTKKFKEVLTERILLSDLKKQAKTKKADIAIRDFQLRTAKEYEQLKDAHRITKLSVPDANNIKRRIPFEKNVVSKGLVYRETYNFQFNTDDWVTDVINRACNLDAFDNKSKYKWVTIEWFTSPSSTIMMTGTKEIRPMPKMSQQKVELMTTLEDVRMEHSDDDGIPYWDITASKWLQFTMMENMRRSEIRMSSARVLQANIKDDWYSKKRMAFQEMLTMYMTVIIEYELLK